MKTFKEFLSEASIFTGNSRVNLTGNVKDNMKSHEQKLKDSGHEILGNEETLSGYGREIISKKEGKKFVHTIRPHLHGTTIETKVQ